MTCLCFHIATKLSSCEVLRRLSPNVNDSFPLIFTKTTCVCECEIRPLAAAFVTFCGHSKDTTAIFVWLLNELSSHQRFLGHTRIKVSWSLHWRHHEQWTRIVLCSVGSDRAVSSSTNPAAVGTRHIPDCLESQLNVCHINMRVTLKAANHSSSARVWTGPAMSWAP